MDISIIVPTLNEEKRILQCLKHLRNQTFKGKYEIIVADGNSEDKTRTRAKKLADNVVIENVRRISAERQAGAKHATGKIFAFTDADSLAPRDWLETIWEAFQNNPNTTGIYGPVYFPKDFFSEFFMRFYLSITSFIGLHSPIGSNLAVTAKAFKKINGFNTNLTTSEDMDLYKRLAKKGSVHYIPEMQMLVSNRRLKQWGHLYFFWFHTVNFFQYHFLGKSHSHYENIR